MKKLKLLDTFSGIGGFSYAAEKLVGGYETKPTIHRTVDGISNRVDRLKALGNAVVPQVAAIPLQRVKTLHESLTTVDH